MRREELRQLRLRQAAHADVEEESLVRRYSGNIPLTFRAERTFTLTPQEVRPLHLCAQSHCAILRCTLTHQGAVISDSRGAHRACEESP